MEESDLLEHFLGHVVGFEKNLELEFVEVVGEERFGVRFELDWKETNASSLKIRGPQVDLMMASLLCTHRTGSRPP